MKALVLIISVIIISITLNLVRYYQCNYYLQKYIDWLKGEKNHLIRDKSVVKNLILNSGVKDSFIPHAEPIGYGRLATYTVSVLDNFPNRYENFAQVTYSMFESAIGAYKNRVFNTINPLFGLNLPYFYHDIYLVIWGLVLITSA